MFLKACLNGSREAGEHLAFPITPEELDRDDAAVSAVGAQALHMHPCDPSDKQSWTAEDQAAPLSAIRQRCPSLPVGVSMALWIEPDVAIRLMGRALVWKIRSGGLMGA